MIWLFQSTRLRKPRLLRLVTGNNWIEFQSTRLRKPRRQKWMVTFMDLDFNPRGYASLDAQTYQGPRSVDYFNPRGYASLDYYWTFSWPIWLYFNPRGYASLDFHQQNKSHLYQISIHEATQASTKKDTVRMQPSKISIHEATQASTAKPCKKITQYTFKTINFLQTTILHPIINFKNNYVHKNFSTFFGANPPVFSCALDIRT